jgi:8-oxo-dGTP diphosphatase
VRPARPSADEATVRAAGGVVWRSVEGAVEVVVVHRPRYDDWSLPKGKLERGESFEDAAVREVEEETGIIAELGDELPVITYWDRNGRPKVVRYWAMTPRRATPFVANHEVDDVRWQAVDEARAKLTYDTDVETLDAFVEVASGGG